MSQIITLLVNGQTGQVQIVASDGLSLATTRDALSVALAAVNEREIRERIEAERAEKAAQSEAPSEPPVLDG